MKHRETGWCVWAANKAVNTPNVRDAQSTESCSAAILAQAILAQAISSQATHCLHVCRGKVWCRVFVFTVLWDAPERMDFDRRPRWLVAGSPWEETASAEVAKGGAQVSRSTATCAAWVTSSSPHSRPGVAGAHGPRHVHRRSTCQGGQVGGRHQRSRRERSRSQFFEGSSPRRAGAVSGAPCGPAHRGDSGVHRASEEAHPGSPRRGDQSPGSCRCRDCKASQGGGIIAARRGTFGKSSAGGGRCPTTPSSSTSAFRFGRRIDTSAGMCERPPQREGRVALTDRRFRQRWAGGTSQEVQVSGNAIPPTS